MCATANADEQRNGICLGFPYEACYLSDDPCSNSVVVEASHGLAEF